MKHISTALLLGVLAAGTARADVDVSKLPPASTKQDVTFDKDIRPLLQASCVGCHRGDRPRGGLRLDTLENVMKGTREGKVVVPGQSAKSQLVIAASQIDPKTAMPPKRQARRGGPGGPGGPNGPQGGMTNQPAGGQPPRQMGPPPKPLTAEEVGLLRAWIDQGAK